MKPWTALCLGLLMLALAGSAQAQSLSLGLFGRTPQDYLTPTLELAYPLEGLTLGARAQRDAFGVSLEAALELGAVGRLAYGAGASLGLAGWGVEGFARGSLAQVALEASLAYASSAWGSLWVGDPDPAGLSGLLAGRYRLSPTQTAGLTLAYTEPLLTTEATLSWRSRATTTFGLGWRVGPYALLGWRGEIAEDGTLLEALVRAGYRNELDTALAVPIAEESFLRLRLALAYGLASGQFSGRLALELERYRLEASYDAGFALWLRYTLNFGQ